MRLLAFILLISLSNLSAQSDSIPMPQNFHSIHSDSLTHFLSRYEVLQEMEDLILAESEFDIDFRLLVLLKDSVFVIKLLADMGVTDMKSKDDQFSYLYKSIKYDTDSSLVYEITYMESSVWRYGEMSGKYKLIINVDHKKVLFDEPVTYFYANQLDDDQYEEVRSSQEVSFQNGTLIVSPFHISGGNKEAYNYYEAGTYLPKKSYWKRQE